MNIIFKKSSIDDLDLLFDWVNEDMVRKNSFSNDIITYNQHAEWFKDKINSENTKIFICYLDDKPVGQVRIDIIGMDGYIDYSVDKYYRKKGIGTIILKNIKDIILELNIKVSRLIGKVKKDNHGSINAFIKAGFQEDSSGDIKIYIKDI
jgi:spore coat polysaccharide biosynthesis protein SpsF